MFKDCNNKKVMSLCKGKDSLLIPYTDTLLSFIFKLRETGMPVSTTMVLMKAAQVCHDFHEKTREAQVSITKRFVKVHGMVHPIGTHLSQQAPGEMQGEALDFIITTIYERSRVTPRLHYKYGPDTHPIHLQCQVHSGYCRHLNCPYS